MSSATMENGSPDFVEYFRSIFHEQIALFLTFSLFLAILCAIALSFASYFAFIRIASLMGYNVRHLAPNEDLHHLEEAHATRQLNTMAKLPCSQTCYCRLLPQKSELPLFLEKPARRLPESPPSEKKIRDSTYEMMFTIISSSSSSSFGSGDSDSLDHSATVSGSPTSYRKKVFSPPGLSPDWKPQLDFTKSMGPKSTSTPVSLSRNKRQLVNIPPAAHLRRDTRREVQHGLKPVSPSVTGRWNSRLRSPSFI